MFCIFTGITSNTYFTRASILVNLMTSTRAVRPSMTIVHCEQLVCDLSAALFKETPLALEVASCDGCMKNVELPVQITVEISHMACLNAKIDELCLERLQLCKCACIESRQIKIVGS